MVGRFEEVRQGFKNCENYFSNSIGFEEFMRRVLG